MRGRVLFDVVIFKEESDRTTGKMDQHAQRVPLLEKDQAAIYRLVARVSPAPLRTSRTTTDTVHDSSERETSLLEMP